MKITKTIAEDVATKYVNSLHLEKLQLLDIKLFELGLKLVRTQFSKEEQEAISKLPDTVFKKTRYFDFIKESTPADRFGFYLDNHIIYKSTSVLLSDENYKEIQDLFNSVNKLRDFIHESRNRLEELIFSFRTYNKLEVALPEVCKFIDNEEKKSTAVALNVEQFMNDLKQGV